MSYYAGTLLCYAKIDVEIEEFFPIYIYTYPYINTNMAAIDTSLVEEKEKKKNARTTMIK